MFVVGSATMSQFMPITFSLFFSPEQEAKTTFFLELIDLRFIYQYRHTLRLNHHQQIKVEVLVDLKRDN